MLYLMDTIEILKVTLRALRSPTKPRKDQEEHRRQLLRAASGADVVTYDPFSEAPDPWHLS